MFLKSVKLTVQESKSAQAKLHFKKSEKVYKIE